MRTAYILLLGASLSLAQTDDWPAYGHDPGGMRYSPLKQITPENVSGLQRAWTVHTGDTGKMFQTTPIVIDHVLYFTTQRLRVIAVEPETGKQLWSYDPKAPPREHRGVSYWPGDRQTPGRIMLATSDGRLIALDAKTGVPVAGFGDNGTVNLRAGVADKFPRASYSVTSPPAIYKDLVILGPSTQEGPSLGPSGDIRAFDARTGRQVWRFHTVPQPGEPGSETWGPDGWKDRAGPSAWGFITVDTERGMVFAPIGNPADSFYGADRKGTDLYSSSIVALDAATGKLRWHYQLVHHDIFDYDTAAPPALVEVQRNGRSIPALAQITKMGLLFILDRTTGQPVFGVEERPVPKSQVPGEEAWPTQPIPLKPPPLSRMSMTRAEVSKRTPEAEKYCIEWFDRLANQGPYTPIGTTPSLLFPGQMGGGNWHGVSYDPQLHFIFVNISHLGTTGQLKATPPGSPVAYRNEGAYTRFVDKDLYPCQQPPWGEMIAVNANTGDVAWRSPLGVFEELEAKGMKGTGTPNIGGSIATAGGLVFIGATLDMRLHAYDSRTGKEVWWGKLDASNNATPITYLGRDGKQYVVASSGGAGHLQNIDANASDSGDSLIAFALGANGTATPATTRAAPAATAAGSTTALTEAQGKALVERVCTQCHGTETFTNSRMSRERWSDEVTDMVGRGAVANESEIKSIVDYLTSHFGR